MSQWTPQHESVVQLAQVLDQSTSANNQVRAQAKQALEDARRQPDLDNYLTYLLITAGNDAQPNLRASAGILLKNNIREGYLSMPESTKEYVKSQIVQGLVDQWPIIRNVSGTVITTILSSGGVSSWPSILGDLMSMAESSDARASESAMSTLGKVCEDSAQDLDREINGERPLNYMIPKFLQFTKSPSPKVRSKAVFCLVQFVIVQSQAALAHLDDFLGSLFELATDADSDTRRNVCTAFVNILEVRPDKLLPHLEGVINYSLHCIKDEDEQIASEGCEFILGLAESNAIDQNIVKPFLPKIIPVILSTMVYSEMDRQILEGMDEDDQAVEDRPEDIRPVMAKSKEAHSTEKKDVASENKTNQDDDDDDDDLDEDLELGLAEWNLRKCSAAALDVFATPFPDVVLETAMPYLKENVVSPEWYVREAAILAFGAVAEGCLSLVSPQLDSLVPFLVERLNDDHAPVRQISCWTLGRYSRWIVESQSTRGNEIFLPVLQGLLKCCLDRNKKVQESGCSAFATFTESAGDALVPYLEAILMHIRMCFKKYKAKNLMILYDAVQTLTDRVSTALCEEKYINLLLPPLIEKWGQLQDDDRDLWPLLECMSSVTATLGEFFAPYAPPVFERSVRILHNNLMQDQHYQVDPNSVDPPEKDFIITSLDLLDGLVQGLGAATSELISQTQPPLVEMMNVCFTDEVYEVRQSAFALLGDMSMLTFDQVRPHFDHLIRACMAQIDSSDHLASAVCNNATWSVGEMTLQADRQMLEPHFQELMERLVRLLKSHAVATVLENAAIALGRLGKPMPDVVAPHLSMFIDEWCKHIQNVEETEEKDSAVQGMCQIVGANPSGLSNPDSLVKFIETVALYMEPSHELAMLIAKVLEGYKGYVEDWDSVVMSKLSQFAAASLRERYGV